MTAFPRFLLALALLLASGCVRPAPVPRGQTPVVPKVMLATAPADPATSASPVVVVTPLAAQPGPVVQPEQTAEAVVSVEALNVREGPGTTFAINGQLASGAGFTAEGRALGNDWVLVESGPVRGWVAVLYTSLYDTPALAALPLVEAPGAQLIRGVVADASGAGIDRVSFAAVQGQGAGAPRTDAASLADGRFFAYLPADASGDWIVSLVSVDCKSRVVDSACAIRGSFEPMFVTVTLPATEPLQFRYNAP